MRAIGVEGMTLLMRHRDSKKRPGLPKEDRAAAFPTRPSAYLPKKRKKPGRAPREGWPAGASSVGYPARMDTARHSSDDRLAIAKLSGKTSRLAAASWHDSYNQAAAVAELHTISTDPHLLAHAARGPREPLYEATRALLLAAGATAEDLDAQAAALDRLQQQHGMPVGEGWQVTRPE